MKSRAEQAEPARGIVTSAKPKAPLIGASAGGLEEAALHAMYAQIIEASADAIYSYDLGGCILTWNTGAEKLYGYAASASARVMRSARIIAWAAARSEGSSIVASGKLGEASKWNAPHMVAISFRQHLYYPLLSPEPDAIVPFKMRPMAISESSEIQFVKDLMAFYDSAAGKAGLQGKSLYLLRNADTRSKGLGFALAGNFYPDFLLWLVDDATGKQWLSFIDPKGIRNMNLSDPKFGLFQEIKQIEKQLADPDITLNSFILSVTSFTDMLNVMGSATKSELEDRHILFMDGGSEAYMQKLIAKALA